MSNGLNKRFMRDPVGFMRRDVLHTSRMKAFCKVKHQPIPTAGTYEFDLVRDSDGAVQLQTVDHRSRPLTSHSNRIVAHWLPWGGANDAPTNHAPTTDMLISDAADYFFTSQLAGCQMLIATVQGGLRAFHIAHNSVTSRKREEEGRRLVQDYDRALRWSSTRNYGKDEIVNFVGVRRNGGWVFYSQSTNQGVNAVNVVQVH